MGVQRRRVKVRPKRFDKVQTPMAGYRAFSIAHHRTFLKLDDAFLKSISPQTKILEIGFGSGRLTKFLLKNTELRPENLQVIDSMYNNWDANPLDVEYHGREINPTKPKVPYVKRKIARLIARKRLTVIRAEATEHRYPKDFFDHVIFSEGIFGLDTKYFLQQIAQAVKHGGTLRMSNIQKAFESMGIDFFWWEPQNRERLLEKLRHIVPQEFEITDLTERGLILRRK